MSFFNSEVVRAEMTEISELQEEIYQNVFKFSTMDKQEKLRHVQTLERLLDKQKVLYTRLSLSDDPEAVTMKDRISESARMMGLPSNVDMNVIFNNMSKMLEVMKEKIDKTGSDL
jgi:GTPase Era involved in 16S rRNA processing